MVGTRGGNTLIPSCPRLLANDELNQTAVAMVALLAWRLHLQLGACSRFAEVNVRFMQVCRQHKDFDIFIDGYKSIIRYLALKAERRQPIAGIIHLIRDPRAFAASGKRKGMTVEAACRLWIKSHRRIDAAIRLVGEKALTLRYEDLCADPEAGLASILAWLGVPQQPLIRPIDPERHWIGSGSMKNFDGRIKLRERWREELSGAELDTIIKLAAAKAHRRGYAILRPEV